MSANDQQETNARLLDLAVDLARQGVREGLGGPFGAVVVRNNKVIGRGQNRVLATNDPTAHAEVVAIREACLAVGAPHLVGCRIISSCEPCPMCLGAIYWAQLAEIVYASSHDEAAAIGFSDAHIYDELALPTEHRKVPARRQPHAAADRLFSEFAADPNRRLY